MPPMKSIMTTNEVAEILGVTARSVKSYIHQGRLEALTYTPKTATKKHHHITADALSRFIQNSAVQPRKLKSKLKQRDL